jgi:membrane protein required for beta-lactamase induction
MKFSIRYVLVWIAIIAALLCHARWYAIDYLPAHRASWGIDPVLTWKDYVIVGWMHVVVAVMLWGIGSSIRESGEDLK